MINMKNVAENENFSLEELSGRSELILKNFSSQKWNHHFHDMYQKSQNHRHRRSKYELMGTNSAGESYKGVLSGNIYDRPISVRKTEMPARNMGQRKKSSNCRPQKEKKAKYRQKKRYWIPFDISSGKVLMTNSSRKSPRPQNLILCFFEAKDSF